MQTETEPTLLEYAAEHRAEPYWEDVYQSLLRVVSRISCGVCQQRAYNDAGHRVLELNDAGLCSDCAGRVDGITTSVKTSRANDACEMCGLPSWARGTSGIRITLRVAAENKFRRERKRTVWSCSQSCAIQAFAVSLMGPASHKWPVSLAEFTTAHRQEIERAIEARSNRSETPSEVADFIESETGDFADLTLPHIPPVSERSQGKSARGGRPRKWACDAERMRAQRAAKREAYAG